jgi:hypothetical protein
MAGYYSRSMCNDFCTYSNCAAMSWNKGGTYRIGYLTSTLPSFPCRSYNLIFALSHLQSSLVQVTMTVANVIAMLFVIIAGGYLGFQTGWKGYSVPGG